MKRLLGIIVGVVLGWGFLLPASAHAEVIRNFAVQATIDSERNLSIVETITYDFEDEERHGIYRTIPVRYERDGGVYKLRLKDIEVEMDGKPVDVDISSPGDDIEIKIGDAETLITGSHVYTIRYKTNRAINFFEEHSELYWNVTGDDWPATIEKASFSIGLPSAVLQYPPRVACYTGPYGSPAAECDTTSNTTFVTFKATRALLSGEGFTVVVGLPSGVIRAPTVWERIRMTLHDNILYGLPILAFGIMFYVWWKYGRDPELRTVIPEYEAPDGYRPHEVAAIMERGNVPSRGITAAILDMAQRGLIHIRFAEEKTFFSKKHTYTLVKQGNASGLDQASMELYRGLFQKGDEIRVDEFRKNKIYSVAKTFRGETRTRIDKDKLFARSWYNEPGVYLGMGFGCAWLFGIPGLITAIILVLFGLIMPKRTIKGVEVLRKLKGFEQYLTVAEKDRIIFHNAPAKTPERFLELLPFAVALGVEKEWADKFKDIDLEPPEWAEGYRPTNAMWAGAFVHDLGSIHAAAAAGYSPPSSAGSGGSGFGGGGSGGGMGGGGGGSW